MQKRFITLEQLQDKPEDMEELKGLSTRQRQALYNWLTARAYRYNKDVLRDAALYVRNDLMKDTKRKENVIPFDREVTIKKPSSFLPSVLNDLPKKDPVVGKVHPDNVH